MGRDEFGTEQREEEIEVMMKMNNSFEEIIPTKKISEINGDGLFQVEVVSQNNQGVIVVPEESSNGNGDYHEVTVADTTTSTINKEIQGEDQLKSVYLDTDEGIWKCRHCIWTYRMESVEIDAIQKPNGHCHKPMNIQILNQKDPCFDLEIKGSESTKGATGMKNLSPDGRPSEKAPITDESDSEVKNPETGKALANETDHQGNMKNFLQTGLHVLLSENHSENGHVSFKPVVEEIKQEVAEWDVEKVIEEQETHDLYCPNCNSCITKRVILRKRKRPGYVLANGKKREKTETPLQSGLGADPSASASYGTGSSTVEPGSSFSPDALGANDREPDSAPDVFRCLSCLSFFIPTVAGIKRIFGVKDESVSTQTPEQTPPRSTVTGQQGNNAIAQLPDLRAPLLNNSLVESKDPEDGGNLDSHKEEKDVVVSHDQGTQLLGKEKASETPNGTKTKFADDTNGSSSTLSTTYPFIAEVHVPNHMMVTVGKHDKDAQIDITLSKESDALLSGSDEKDKNEAAGEKIDRGNDVILVVHEESVLGASPSLQIPAAPVVYPVREIEASVATQGVVVPRRSSEWDILKSIVYGGLLEIITSLGVVSSAAGGDAKTLNIVAFGVANLVSGFLIILHSLRELKNEQFGRISEVEEDKVARYEQVLGKKNNFRRHVIFAILSYIIFGLLPPITYGFSFRKSDNKEYKLIAVAAVSLICIILLATGKAYTKKSPKSYMKTIFYYVSIGVMASGLSYVFGELIKDLLEKLALFEPSSLAPVPPSAAFLQGIPSSANPTTWASY